MRSHVSTVVFIFTLLAASMFLYSGVEQRTQELQRDYNTFRPPPLSSLSTNLINIITLGHKNVYDDFINLWLLQTLIEENRPNSPEHMMQSIRSVIRHKPKLETTYLLSCIVMYDDYKRPEFCQEIVLAGLEAFPTSWRLPILQGYIHNFVLKEPAQAASFFLMASSRKSAPDWIKRVVKKLLSNNNLQGNDLNKGIELLKDSPNASSFQDIIDQMKKLAQ